MPRDVKRATLLADTRVGWPDGAPIPEATEQRGRCASATHGRRSAISAQRGRRQRIGLGKEADMTGNAFAGNRECGLGLRDGLGMSTEPCSPASCGWCAGASWRAMPTAYGK
jgi:hypothetical protein